MRERLSAADRRASILDAAARVFGERGYEATRMDDVADEADVAKGLLYKHFPSKDSLFAALVDERVREFAGDLSDALSAAPKDPESMLQTGFALWLKTVSRGEVPLSDPGLHAAYVAARDRVRALLAGLVGVMHPKMPPNEAWLLAAAIQGAAEAVGDVWYRRRDVPAKTAAALLARFCWQGLQSIRAGRRTS